RATSTEPCSSCTPVSPWPTSSTIERSGSAGICGSEASCSTAASSWKRKRICGAAPSWPLRSVAAATRLEPPACSAPCSATGETTSATASFSRAVQLLEDQQLIVDLAEARLAFARALRSFGEQTAARTELEQARATFKRIGADARLPTIDRELQEVAGAG